MNEYIVNGKKIICYPAKPCIRLSEAVKYYMCALIPKGRLITEGSLETFLAKKLKIDRVEFRLDTFDQMKHIDNVLKYDKTHRIVSVLGRVDKVNMEKLQKEGFTFALATKYMVKINNFKEYLFDFEKETDIDAAFIERIDREGYSSLKELNSICE